MASPSNATKEALEAAADEGERAYAAGDGVLANPYRVHKGLRAAWRRGWVRAHGE